MQKFVAPLLVLAALFGSTGVEAQTFTPADAARLARGETVERREKLDLRSGRYVGGTTYTFLDASPDEIDSLLADVSSYRHFLPYTKDARLVARDGSDLVVWLRQGNALLDASYTIRVRPESSSPRVVRFWLDRSRAHGIADASGFFRYEPAPGPPASPGKRPLLLTFCIWVDVGPGMVRVLFEGRIQNIVLSVPQHLRDYVAERQRHGAAAAVR
jgi:hypothetical protein